AGDEKSGDKEIIDVGYEADATFAATGKAFEEEMADALKEDAPGASVMSGHIDALAMPSKEEILGIVSRSVEKSISDIIGSDSIAALSAAIKEVVSAALAQDAPRIIADVTKELVMEMMQSLRGEIISAIDRVVPEVAETVIKREIEKITAEP